MSEQNSGSSLMPLIGTMVSLEEMKGRQLRLFQSLTPREKQVLAKVAEGRSNPAIAHQLGISRVTVQNHRAGIRQKLGIDSEADYLKYALAYDLVRF